MNVEEMVELHQTMIEFLCQHNVEQLNWCVSSTQYQKDKFRIVQLRCYDGGDRELGNYRSSLRLNFRTNQHHFQDHTDNVQMVLNQSRSWAYDTNRDVQKLTMIDLIPRVQNHQKNNTPCCCNLDLLGTEIPKMYRYMDRRLNMARKLSYDCCPGY